MLNHVYGIPVYLKDEKSLVLLDRCLSSLNSQITSSKIEVILYNDRSPFKTELYLEKYTNLNITYIEGDVNVGPGVSRNRILSKAKECEYSYIMFLDYDDVIHNSLIDNQVTGMLNNGKHAVLAIPFLRQLVSPKGEFEYSLISGEMNWLHGKYYNVKYLADKNIEFPDLRSHEDVCFNLQVTELLTSFSNFHPTEGYGQISMVNPEHGIFSIVWTYNENSLSTTDIYGNLSQNIKSVSLAYDRINNNNVLSILAFNLYVFASLTKDKSDKTSDYDNLFKSLTENSLNEVRRFFSEIKFSVNSMNTYQPVILDFFKNGNDNALSHYKEVYGEFKKLDMETFLNKLRSDV